MPAKTPHPRRTPILIRANRSPVATVRCTYVGTFSKGQCLQQAPPGTDRCTLPGHPRGTA